MQSNKSNSFYKHKDKMFKQSNVFHPMLEVADKNNKFIINIMEHIIVMKLEIESIVTNSINNYKRITKFSKKQK